MIKKIAPKIYTFLMFFFLYAPIAVLIIFSFNNSRHTAVWNGFTFKWYGELFRDRTIMKSLYYTVIVAVLSSLTACVIGTITAFGISGLRGKRRNVLLGINQLPVVNPDIVTAVALMSMFTFLKVDKGLLTMLLSHITFNIPYVILSVLPKLKQLPKNTWEAALDLGASESYAFRKVILPQIMPGVITGLLIAFTMSIDDFVISFFNTGNGVSNLSITIYSMARKGLNPKINAVSTLLFVSVLLLLIVINLRASKKNK